MAQVTLSIGGRPMPVACRDGEEARVQQLGRMLDQRWSAAQRAAGGVNTERAMFFLALMLADDLDEAVNRPASDGGVSEAAIARIAERLERLADALEQTPASA
jgi:cell division protein ZapA